VSTVVQNCKCGATCGGNTGNGRGYWYNSHSGLDIGVISNTPIYAAHTGRVVARGDAGDGYGNKLVIRDLENPQFFTLYGHLSSITVPSTQDEILRGEQIGLSGETGAPGAPHLHFGFYYNVRSDSPPYVLDPYAWFSKLTNSLGAGHTDYRWASGVVANGNMGAPNDWNHGTVIGNEYVSKTRARNGARAIGVANSTGVDGIERFWSDSLGAPGAPITSAYWDAGHGGDCQEFEGGTWCPDGYRGRFQDVGWDFWAHRYVGWSNREGVVGGYPCGGAGEPCGTTNLPYFRPTAPVSRAQFAKIMVEGFSIPVNTSGGPHFCDVATNNWAYNYIETLYNTTVTVDGVLERLMSGSPCGCGNCFNPGSNLKRGQVSKVVVLTAHYKNWFCGHGSAGGPDFYDVPTNQTFYKYVEKLYNAGAVQYRQEDGTAGAGGHYFVDWDATRAEVTQFLHELIYAVSPPPPNTCR
jgi:hypothetical protein